MVKSAVIFRSSPRENGNTNSLTDAVSAELKQSGCRVTEFDLNDMDIRPCTSCRECQKDWTVVNCAQYDDFGTLAAAVKESDMIVLSTPIYSWYCAPPMKALLDRMVYAFNMYYGEKRGPSLWEGKQVAVVTTCGYPPEKGADLFEEGIKRFCRHSKLEYLGMICEQNKGYQLAFMDEKKTKHAKEFAEGLLK
ncbi:MAG: flavodoxin family protein [Bacillota bacterium]|nr:flavodoxin family protein [Bacillota bacterium]